MRSDRRWFGLVIMVVMMAGMVTVAHGQQKSSTRATVRRSPRVNPAEHQLLWRVTHPDLRDTSYVFGTMHVRDRRAFGFGDSLLPLMRRCRTFASEVDFNELADTLAKHLTMWAAGHPLPAWLQGLMPLQDSVVREQFMRRLSEELRSQRQSGWKPSLGNRFLADAATLTDRGRLYNDYPVILDVWLASEARRTGLNLTGVETMSEVIDYVGRMHALHDRMPEEDLADSLSPPYVHRYNADTTDDRTLITLYQRGVLQDIERMGLENVPPDVRSWLLDLRNGIMAERADVLMRKQATFVAVGALHLPGDLGLLTLLRDRGYRVEMVRNSFHDSLPAEEIDPNVDHGWSTWFSDDRSLEIALPLRIASAQTTLPAMTDSSDHGDRDEQTDAVVVGLDVMRASFAFVTSVSCSPHDEDAIGPWFAELIQNYAQTGRTYTLPTFDRSIQGAIAIDTAWGAPVLIDGERVVPMMVKVRTPTSNTGVLLFARRGAIVPARVVLPRIVYKSELIDTTSVDVALPESDLVIRMPRRYTVKLGKHGGWMTGHDRREGKGVLVFWIGNKKWLGTAVDNARALFDIPIRPASSDAVVQFLRANYVDTSGVDTYVRNGVIGAVPYKVAMGTGRGEYERHYVTCWAIQYGARVYYGLDIGDNERPFTPSVASLRRIALPTAPCSRIDLDSGRLVMEVPEVRAKVTSPFSGLDSLSALPVASRWQMRSVVVAMDTARGVDVAIERVALSPHQRWESVEVYLRNLVDKREGLRTTTVVRTFSPVSGMIVEYPDTSSPGLSWIRAIAVRPGSAYCISMVGRGDAASRLWFDSLLATLTLPNVERPQTTTRIASVVENDDGLVNEVGSSWPWLQLTEEQWDDLSTALRTQSVEQVASGSPHWLQRGFRLLRSQDSVRHLGLLIDVFKEAATVDARRELLSLLCAVKHPRAYDVVFEAIAENDGRFGNEPIYEWLFWARPGVLDPRHVVPSFLNQRPFRHALLLYYQQQADSNRLDEGAREWLLDHGDSVFNAELQFARRLPQDSAYYPLWSLYQAYSLQRFVRGIDRTSLEQAHALTELEPMATSWYMHDLVLDIVVEGERLRPAAMQRCLTDKQLWYSLYDSVRAVGKLAMFPDSLSTATRLAEGAAISILLEDEGFGNTHLTATTIAEHQELIGPNAGRWVLVHVTSNVTAGTARIDAAGDEEDEEDDEVEEPTDIVMLVGPFPVGGWKPSEPLAVDVYSNDDTRASMSDADHVETLLEIVNQSRAEAAEEAADDDE